MKRLGINEGTEFGEKLGTVSKRTYEGDETVLLRGHAIIELFGPDGVLKERREVDNTICTAGKNQILLFTSGQLLSTFNFMAIGTSATSPSAGDTTLGAEVARTSGITPTNPSATILQFVGTYGAGVGTGSIVECGLLDASSSGHLLSHLTFSVITKGSGDSLTITYQLS